MKGIAGKHTYKIIDSDWIKIFGGKQGWQHK